jgi:GR25 family glycosyltransferase involved in LPS biosynthesis
MFRIKDLKKCYYINLPFREDRRAFIEKEIAKSEILISISERFEAVDGYSVHPRLLSNNLLSEKAIEDILMDNINRWGLTLTQGGLGVLLSYLEIFERVKNIKDGLVLTLEDDSIIRENFDEKLENVLAELPSNFDICYLGYGGEKIKNETFSENLIVPTGEITCLPAMIISPGGAETLIKILKNISHQIDTEIYSSRRFLKMFAAKEKLVQIKNEFTSNIQGDKSCIKKYKKQNFIFSTIAHGKKANCDALKLAADLDFFKQKILIVTDDKDSFVGVENVIPVDYGSRDFSYNDKRICFEEGFKISDCVVYVDADSRIFYQNFKPSYTNFFRIAQPGFHPSWNWGKVNKKNGFFDSKDIEERTDGYGEKAMQKCNEMNISLDEAFHYQEGMFAICKENGKEVEFLNTWKELSCSLDEYERSKKSKKIGLGEGNLIGLSLVKSGMTINSEEFVNYLGEDIKYNFYGIYMDEYISNFPGRKIVDNFSGKPLTSKRIEVEFQDKKIDLYYRIYEFNSTLLTLSFEWNKNNNVEFLDHEFKINDEIFHFNSDKFGNFYLKKQNNLEIYHTYDWYGEKIWQKIETLIL